MLYESVRDIYIIELGCQWVSISLTSFQIPLCLLEVEYIKQVWLSLANSQPVWTQFRKPQQLPPIHGPCSSKGIALPRATNAFLAQRDLEKIEPQTWNEDATLIPLSTNLQSYMLYVMLYVAFSGKVSGLKHKLLFISLQMRAAWLVEFFQDFCFCLC